MLGPAQIQLGRTAIGVHRALQSRFHYEAIAMTMIDLFTSIVALTVTALTSLLAAPSLLLAQPACNVDSLPREAIGQGRLAVRIEGEWKQFTQHEDGPAHILEIGGLLHLCIAWEAPPYDGVHRQIVYASTKYSDEQPLWLFRNSAGDGIPFVGRLLGDWNRTPDASGVNPDSAFREFHRRLPENLSNTPWNSLADWHDTSAWFPNVRSYNLVVGAIRALPLLPYGSERLLRLASNRQLTSWVPFTTRAPSAQNELRVAISYTGELDRLGPYVYQYVFQVR